MIGKDHRDLIQAMAPPDRVFRSVPQIPYSQATPSPEPFGILTTLGHLGTASRPAQPHRGILGFMLPPDAVGEGNSRGLTRTDSHAAESPRGPASMDEVTPAEIMSLPPYERWLVTLPDDSPELFGQPDPRVGKAPSNTDSELRDIVYTASDGAEGGDGDQHDDTVTNRADATPIPIPKPLILPPIPPPRPEQLEGPDYPPEFFADRSVLAQIEGGYTDGHNDPTAGGPTNLGITQKTYELWFPGKRVENITPEEANFIFYHGYWAGPDKAEGLPKPVRTLWFDAAVNSGPQAATDQLQRALGMSGMQVDGKMGSATREAVENHPNLNALAAEMLAQRTRLYDSMRMSKDADNRVTYQRNKTGWNNRLGNLASSSGVTPIDHATPTYSRGYYDPLFQAHAYPGYWIKER